MYLAVGPSQRRQVEDTSPWADDARSSWLTDLRMISDGTGGRAPADACPDCVAESQIWQRDFLERQTASMDTVHRNTRSSEDEDMEKPVPVDNTVLGSDSAPGELVSAAPTNDSQPNRLIIVFEAHGEVETAIFTHAGQIERVIADDPANIPTIETIERIAHELVNVSDALTSPEFLESLYGTTQQPSPGYETDPRGNSHVEEHETQDSFTFPSIEDRSGVRGHQHAGRNADIALDVRQTEGPDYRAVRRTMSLQQLKAARQASSKERQFRRERRLGALMRDGLV